VAIAAAAVALFVSTTSGRSTARTGTALLRTTAPVDGLAADGAVVLVKTASCHGPTAPLDQLLAWNPVRGRVVHVPGPRCKGVVPYTTVLEEAVAADRVAWVPWIGGLSGSTWLLTATIRGPKAIVRFTRDAGRTSDGGLGDSVGNVHGDGSLLVFNTWSDCLTEPQEPDFYPCPKGIPARTRTTYRERLWRVVGGRKRLLAASRNELAAVSVAAGRILVRRADGSLELRGATGALLRRFPFRPGEVQAAVLDATELVVLYRRGPGLTWRVYRPGSGNLVRVLAASPEVGGAIHPTRTPERPISDLLDVERGVLAYAVGRTVHVVRLADGRAATFRPSAVTVPGRPPVFVQLEPPGLTYAYDVRGPLQGRVRFAPFGAIRFGRP
jgi:hypothetical protein